MDPHTPHGNFMSDRDLIQEMGGILNAGFGTVKTTISIILNLLAVHPNIQEDLLEVPQRSYIFADIRYQQVSPLQFSSTDYTDTLSIGQTLSSLTRIDFCRLNHPKDIPTHLCPSV
ncbi:hypothetical protein M8J76_008466 [Diaphorina citri]|nr:hypothetical protein M8J76_008466 [Diaphorina citri]